MHCGAFYLNRFPMNTFSPSVLRSAILCGLFSLLASSGPALAFSDDEARRAILDLREQVHQMAEQERRIRLDFAEQIEALKSEVMSLRGKVEQLNWAAGLHKNASGQDSADRSEERRVGKEDGRHGEPEN